MNMSEFYSEFLFRYQTDGAPRKISINAYCIQEGVECRNFIKWYRDNKKRIRESEMEEIRLRPVTLTGASPEHSPIPLLSSHSSSEDANVVCFHLKLSNGIEINKENCNLESLTYLLQSMRRDNKNLSNQLSQALEDKAQSEKQSALLSSALEELKNLHASELFEIEKQKHQLYGCKSEKSSSLRKVPDKDLKSDKDDFDGSNPPKVSCDDSSTPVTSEMTNSEPASSFSSVSRPHRSDYSKRCTRVDNVLMHYCDVSGIPSDARKLDVRHWILYKLDWSVTKHVLELLRLIDKEGTISNYYKADEANDTLHPFANVLPGYHVDIDMIAQILVDKYQYSMSLERVVDRFKDVDADFSSSTVLNWVHRHIREFDKLDAPLRSILLTEGSFLFCDETTEQVKVFNKSTGKFEYRKKYILGIKNSALKVAYYLYDHGSFSMAVAENFFRNFFGSITTDGYNVYKLFDRHRKGITRYGCMAHVRCKFVDALNTSSRYLMRPRFLLPIFSSRRFVMR